MKVIAVLLLAVAVASAGTLPNPKSVHPRDRIMVQSIESRVIGGDNAKEGQFRYQVGIVFSNILSGWFCGGSIIGTKYILTAAHCTNGALFGTIYLGNVTLQSGKEVTFSFSNIKQHAGFNSTSLENDISIIKLSSPIQFGPNIDKIGLPSLARSSDTYEGLNVVVSGWGYTNNTGPSQPTILQWALLPVISNSECNTTYKDITDANICTFVWGKATCYGDSGGPLVDETTVPIQIGIVSFGSSLGCDQAPSGYTSTKYHRTWINTMSGI